MLRSYGKTQHFLLFLLVSIFSTGIIQASEQDADAISRNIQALHMPYGTILDPVFASSDPNSPQFSELVSYAHAGDSAIWTGHYLAAEAFRYQVTRSPEAFDNAWRALRGIHALLDVTGTDVLARFKMPANSEFAAAVQKEENRHGIYYNSLDGTQYFWIGNTSRDQYSGVMFGLSVAYDMIDNTEMRNFIRADVTRILNYLMGHAWNVVMPDGSISTTFVHRPDQELAFLQIGRRVNPGKFSITYTIYRGLSAGSVALPIYFDNLDDHGSYFKFNLNYINLYNLVRLEDAGSSYRRTYLGAYNMLRDRTQTHGNAHFNMLDREISGPNASRDSETLNILESWLQRPRRDYWVDLRDRYPSCGDDRACIPLPVNDRVNTDFLWQRSPFLLFGGGFGTTETAGIDYLLAYWMARRNGLTSQ